MDQRDNFNDLTGEAKRFYEIHGCQLLGMAFPPNISLLKQLQHKLEQQIFDAGDFFEVLDNQDEESFVTQTKVPIDAASQVFLIDHCVSFKYYDLTQHLEQQPNLGKRLSTMLKYWKEKKKIPGLQQENSLSMNQEEYDSMHIEDPNKVQVNSDIETLSFFDNDIQNLSLVESLLEKLPQLRALWLNENPISKNEKFESLRQMIEDKFPKIEILNSKFTKHASSWAFKFVTFENNLPKSFQTPSTEVYHLALCDRDVFHVQDFSKKLQQEFPKLRSLDIRETDIKDYYEANKFFDMLKDCQIKYLYCDISIEHVLWELNYNGKLSDIVQQQIMVNGRDLNTTKPISEENNQIQQLKKNVFKLASSYRLLSTDQMDEQSVWYVMDELGSAIQHSDIPNVQVMPFLYLPNGIIDDQTISYSILWPNRNLAPSEPIFRDYLVGINELKFRSCRLGVWFDTPFDSFLQAHHQYIENIKSKTVEGLELLKNFKNNENVQTKFVLVPENGTIKVFTDNELLVKYLSLPQCTITEELDDADIIFCNACIDDKISKHYNKWINQFPNEDCIVSKENLALSIQSSLGIVPWLQETYNMQTQLPIFYGAFKQREKNCLDNTWIVKAPNMARSIDMVVTNNLDIITRLLETGPKIVQKYIYQPLTLRKKKIDFRFVVILRSLEPLEVFLYKIFWIRSANIDYTMDENTFTSYENHFTVMNYGHNLTQINYDEFIVEFEQENEGKSWNEVFNKIVSMVKDLFIGIKSIKPEMVSEKSRALYGMDVMISLPDFQPKLLEMTFSPDCNRACKYHPHFYNDLMECMFLGKENQNVFKVI